MIPANVIRPGDFAVVNTGTRYVTAGIRLAEYAADLADFHPDKRVSDWDHAVMCTRIGVEGTVYIAEAQPGGAVEVPWHYDARPHIWSSGIIDMPEAAGSWAIRYTKAGPWGPSGVPYSWADYGALAAHSLHLPAPGLREFIERQGSMICSQLVDRAAMNAGEHLFNDDRWCGFVKPSDLGLLLVS